MEETLINVEVSTFFVVEV